MSPTRALAEDPTVAAAQRVAEAVRLLRVARDPGAALRVLDAIPQDGRSGDLSYEMGALRGEALLALGRLQEALQAIDALPLERLPQAGERTLVRGELRSRFGRWREARDDLARAASLLTSPRDTRGRDLHERALWGVAIALLRLGDERAGRAALDDYLAAYPAGRFAREATRLRAGTP